MSQPEPTSIPMPQPPSDAEEVAYLIRHHLGVSPDRADDLAQVLLRSSWLASYVARQVEAHTHAYLASSAQSWQQDGKDRRRPDRREP